MLHGPRIINSSYFLVELSEYDAKSYLSDPTWSLESFVLLFAGFNAPPNKQNEAMAIEALFRRNPAMQFTKQQLANSGLTGEAATPTAWLRLCERLGLSPSPKLVAAITSEKAGLAVEVPANLHTNKAESINLLNKPSKKDDWFDVINDMATAYHIKHGKLPNRVQAWAALWKSPPDGYQITTGTDRGEDAVIMPGVSPLGKRSFQARWKRYASHNKA